MPGEPAFQRGLVRIGDGHMAYHRAGTADTAILLLHGLGDNGLCWSRTARALAEEFTVIMLDARGHGGSAMPNDPGTYNPAEDIRECLDALNLDRVIVLGHSVGAIAASQFAASHNNRVIALILEDPIFRDKSSAPTKEMVEAYAKQAGAFREMSFEDVVAHGQTQHPTWDECEFEAWAEGKRQVNPAILQQYWFPGWRELVERVQVPTLMLRGEPGSDSALSTRIAKDIESFRPAIQSVVVEGVGHNIHRENFAQFLSIVVEFVKALPVTKG